MRKIVLTLTAVLIFGWQGISFADTAVDSLIQKLKDKGILTDQDAAQLKGEIAAEQQTSQAAQTTAFKSLLPDWLNGLKISGDFRLRDQVQVRKIPGGSSTQGHDNFDQNRARIRARLNFEDQINDKVKIVVGIATDGGTARSNNYTLGGSTSASKDGISNLDSFGKPQLILNKAYAVYTPNDMITVMGGKLDNPIWEPANASFFWDPDITPEGGSIQLQKKLNDYITPFAQEAVFVLHDQTPSVTTSSTTYGVNSTGGVVATTTVTDGVKTDPYMMVTQGGIKGNLTDKVYYKAGVTWYNINNPSHTTFTEGLGINTTTTNPAGATVLRYNFNNVLVEGADIGINDPFGDTLPSPIYIPQIGIFGDFAHNNASQDAQNKAWEAGAYIGNSSINGWGTWKLQSYFKVLERDSWLDILPDDDFYSGDTNTKGWRSQLDLGLAKNVWFTMAYFHDNVFKYYGTTTMSRSAPEDLFQMDLNFKF
jgi:hypothetical protein